MLNERVENQKNKCNCQKFLVALVCFLFLTSVIGVFLAIRYAKARPAANQDSESLEYLDPDLRLGERLVISQEGYENFRVYLNEFFESLKKEGKIIKASVFFRDLADNGPTFSIGANEKFIPASLLKLPLAIAYLRLAEETPGFLDRQLKTNDFKLELNQGFPSPEILEAGKAYAIENLIYRMIVYSDNRAWEILYNHLLQISPEQSLLAETYKDLGIVDSQFKVDTDDSITTKSYASIFRELYSASYLSEKYSQKILRLLVESTFDKGLRLGVPADIPIAHKFGERAFGDGSQLHDCGIVYYPQNPYLLCVMLRGGRNFEALSEAMGVASKLVYQEVDSRRIK